MKKSLTLVGCLAATWIGCSAPAASQVLKSHVLTFDGIDPLRVGTTVGAVREAGFLVQIEQGFDVAECAEASIKGLSEISLMFEQGRISRVEIHSPTIATSEGIRIGSTEAEVRKKYGRRLVVDTHPYDPDGHYFTVPSHDKRLAIVMETDGKTVTSLRAGLADSAQYVEGCL